MAQVRGRFKLSPFSVRLDGILQMTRCAGLDWPNMRKKILLMVVGALFLAGLVVAAQYVTPSPEPEPSAVPTSKGATTGQQDTSDPARTDAVTEVLADDDQGLVRPTAGGGQEPSADPVPSHPVQLDELRAEMPSNLYWKYGAPTDDPDLLSERARDKAAIEKLAGLVRSNTASNEEIDRFFDHKEALSNDYLKFATKVIEEYGDKLPDRELGLYELAQSMHRDRLSQYPAQREQAKRRKREQDEKRETWRNAR